MVIIVSSRVIPQGSSTCLVWPFIFVRPEHCTDTALVEHELVHFRERAWIMPIWVLLYLVSRKFFLAAAIRDYSREIEMGAVTPQQAAHALLSDRLGITFENHAGIGLKEAQSLHWSA
jgi:hypothetical protein